MTDTIDRLAADYREFQLRTDPVAAHMVGHYEYADRFRLVSREAEDAEVADARAFARRATALPAADLDVQQRITREMVALDAQNSADLLEARLVEIDVDPIHGPQAVLPLTLEQLPVPTRDVGEAMVDKLRGIGAMFADLGERHREGLARGRTPARFAVAEAVAQIDAWLAAPPGGGPLAAAVQDPADGAAPGWRERLARVEFAEVRPAMAAYRAILQDEVLPVARPDDRCGLAWLPAGGDAYARALRYYVTRDMSPLEIHEIGRRQVAELATEYMAVGAGALGTRDLATIFERLRSSTDLHHTSGADIVVAARAALAKASAAAPDWFGLLPRVGCEVQATPSGPQAFYFPPASDGSRPGRFFMNTSDPAGWGRFDIESTAYHESIPGHHLQNALAAERPDLPEFRRYAWVTVYGEGWGLYAERLADEMGLYGTAIDRLGMLSNDSMRACRLVVDTGLHALGWSREQAVAYMFDNSPMRRAHIQAEVDRYICSPGQAVAYMIGRLEIQRIRASAESRLGDRFDIRGFHDAVLSSGCIPLSTLASLVDAWVDERAGANSGGAAIAVAR